MARHLMILLASVVVMPLVLSGQDGEIKEAVDGLKQAVKKKDSADQIHYIELLSKRWSEVQPKERKTVLGQARKCLSSRDAEVRRKTVAALGSMGGGKKNKNSDMVVKILQVEVKKKTTEKDIAYFASCLESIGKVKSKAGIDVLRKLLKYKNSDIIAASVQAMMHYRESKLRVRRGLVEELLKTYTSADNQVRRDPANTTFKAKLDKIREPMEAALKALTGQQISGSGEWWKWWNDVGKKGTKW